METKAYRILRLILNLSNSYPKTKEEWTTFLEIKRSASHNYCKVLKFTGFDLYQKGGWHWIEYPDKDHPILKNIFHFTEGDNHLLSRIIDGPEENHATGTRTTNRLLSLSNSNKPIPFYLRKDQERKALVLWKASKTKMKVLMQDYSSGDSMTVNDKVVKPFAFSDGFVLLIQGFAKTGNSRPAGLMI